MDLNLVTVSSTGHFRPADISDIKQGHLTIKRGSCCEKKLEINGTILSKKSTINHVNRFLPAEKKLKQDWFFGLFGGTSRAKVIDTFNSIYPIELEINTSPIPKWMNQASTEIECALLAKARSAELETMLNEYNSKHNAVGHNRNYQPHLENIILALKEYAASCDLTKEFEQKDGHGMTGGPQPNTVGATFELALKNEEGTLTDAVKAVQGGACNIPLELAPIGNKVLELLKKITQKG